LFIQFPKEEAYDYYKRQGLSDKDAAKEAQYVYDAIIREGEKSTFQQDNLVSSLIDAVLASKAGKFAKTPAMLMMPFRKIPLNAGWHVYNYINPQVAMLQSLYFGVNAARKAAKGEEYRHDLRSSQDWLSHAAVGAGLMVATGYLTQLGIFVPNSGDDEKKKEREGERAFTKSGVNVTKLKAFMKGDDPRSIKGGDIVDFRWFGHLGVIADFQSRKLEEMTPEQKLATKTFMEDMTSNLSPASKMVFNQGVFSGTSSMIDAIDKSTSNTTALRMSGINMIGMVTNIIHPAMFSQISRAQIPYETKVKDVAFGKEIKNAMLARSSVLRKLTGEYPPSKIGVWGDKVEKGGNVLTRMFGISEQNPNSFARPLWEDYTKTSNTKFFPPSVKPEVVVDGKKFKLDAKESEQLEIEVGKARSANIAPFISDMKYLEGFDKPYSKLNNDEKLKALEILYSEGFEQGRDKFLSDAKNKNKFNYSKTQEEIDKKEGLKRNAQKFRKSLTQ
jgi:hypothetical protein